MCVFDYVTKKSYFVYQAISWLQLVISQAYTIKGEKRILFLSHTSLPENPIQVNYRSFLKKQRIRILNLETWKKDA